MTKQNFIDNVWDILYNDDYCADMMIAEIGELVNTTDLVDPIVDEISDILENEDFSADAMLTEIECFIDDPENV